MGWLRRKPRIDDATYGRLMTSFGRVVDQDPMLREPAEALAARITAEHREISAALDARMYAGATSYHLRLLAGAWIMTREATVPEATAAAFEEAVAWRFGRLVRGSRRLPERLTRLARGQFERDRTLPAELRP